MSANRSGSLRVTNPMSSTSATATMTTATPTTTIALRYVAGGMGHALPGRRRGERRRVEHRHHLADHRLLRVEAALLVAAERVLDDVDQALVAVGTRPGRPVAAGLEVLDQVVVGDQRTGHADAVAVAFVDRLADDRGGLKPARTDHRHVDGPLDLARVRQVQPLDPLAPVLHPPEAEQLAERPGQEDQLVAKRIPAAGD